MKENIVHVYNYFLFLVRILFPQRVISLIIYLLLLGATIVIIISLLLHVMYYIFYKTRKEEKGAKRAELNEFPKVSVLMPVRSESLEIIERSVKNILNQNYPRSKTEFIIISDDPEDYAGKIERLVHNLLRESGINFIFINRESPRGLKAGALNDALRYATGKYLILLDADAVIPKNYIVELVVFMENNSEFAGAVSDIIPLNSLENELCETQSVAWSFLKKALFIGRQAAGFSVPLVGTCSIVRKDAIINVNGWDESTVTDDLPLTIRLLAKGYKIGFLNQTKAYVEVSKTYKSFKSQQKRWAYGGLRTFIKYFKDIISSKVSPRLKIDISLYLLQYQVTMINLIFISIALLSVLLKVDLLKVPYPISLAWFAAIALYLACYLDSIREEKYSVVKAIINLGRASALMMALIPTFLDASIRALLGKKVEWRVTPKGTFAHKFKEKATMESILGCFLIMAFIYSMINNLFYAGLVFLVFGIPFIYTGYKTFSANW